MNLLLLLRPGTSSVFAVIRGRPISQSCLRAVVVVLLLLLLLRMVYFAWALLRMGGAQGSQRAVLSVHGSAHPHPVWMH